MATRKNKRGRPRVYENGRKEFKLCLPLALFKEVKQAADRHPGGRDISSKIREYIERGLEAERAA